MNIHTQNKEICSDPTFAPATIARAIISLRTKRLSEGNDWVFGLG